jgi:hypothetical protein
MHGDPLAGRGPPGDGVGLVLRGVAGLAQHGPRPGAGHVLEVVRQLDPLVPAAAPESFMSLDRSGRTRLGPVFAVRPPWAGATVLYFDRAGGAAAPRRERRRTGADWLSTARQLREARDNELALEAYRAAAAHGADPAVVAFVEGLCHAQAERWELALARFDAARKGGRADAELWRRTLEAAEAAARWETALEAARALGDAARAAAIEKLRASRTVFLQDFAGAWRPEWRVEAPLACRGPPPTARSS